MSPEEFKISVNRANKKGDITILYTLSKRQYSLGLPDITLSGGYVFDKEYHMVLVKNFERLISVGSMGTNLDFTC
ncbi:hypothetical protein [Paenibacillus typhae]|uniref:hypothetical protein n=1 Tax=Paenibacillus typhae TaxID=1174501 RepID=UPI001C8D72C1|nr:hypothetical protein [Paenibacillus typhae]